MTGTDLQVDTTPDDATLTSSLTFTRENYTARDIKVIANEDEDAVHDTIILTHTVGNESVISATLDRNDHGQ